MLCFYARAITLPEGNLFIPGSKVIKIKRAGLEEYDVAAAHSLQWS